MHIIAKCSKIVIVKEGGGAVFKIMSFICREIVGSRCCAVPKSSASRSHEAVITGCFSENVYFGLPATS